jgi:hypothetical protein
MNLINFAGATNGKKTVSIYHGKHLNSPPPTIWSWSNFAANWLDTTPVGLWFLSGENISNDKDQWVIVQVVEMV